MSDPGLSWDVFVAPSKPVVTSDLPSDLPKRMWSPVSATLIHGKHDAVLVDPLMTVEESRAPGSAAASASAEPPGRQWSAQRQSLALVEDDSGVVGHARGPRLIPVRHDAHPL